MLSVQHVHEQALGCATQIPKPCANHQPSHLALRTPDRGVEVLLCTISCLSPKLDFALVVANSEGTRSSNVANWFLTQMFVFTGSWCCAVGKHLYLGAKHRQVDFTVVASGIITLCLEVTKRALPTAREPRQEGVRHIS